MLGSNLAQNPLMILCHPKASASKIPPPQSKTLTFKLYSKFQISSQKSHTLAQVVCYLLAYQWPPMILACSQVYVLSADLGKNTTMFCFGVHQCFLQTWGSLLEGSSITAESCVCDYVHACLLSVIKFTNQLDCRPVGQIKHYFWVCA